MKTPQVQIGIFTLTMINIAAILSLRNLPLMATFGFGLIAVYAIATCCFFIPCALVTAELASTWPENGGIYAWVSKGLGPRWGFLAIWLQTINTFACFPNVLVFMASALVAGFMPQLTNNPYFNLFFVLSVFWLFTFLNLKGIQVSSRISEIGSLLGTIFPLLLFLGLGLYLLLSQKIKPETPQSWFPSITSLNDLSLFTGALFGFAGIEMSAVYIKHVRNPQKTYVFAIFISALLLLVFSIIGSLVIALVLKPENVLLYSGIIDTFKFLLAQYNLDSYLPIIGILIAIGAGAWVSAWIGGPPQALLVSGVHGHLPPFLNKTNTNGMPSVILYTQAVIVSLFSSAFFLMPSINSAWWILLAISSQLILLMYVFLFLAAIRLRFKFPKIKRSFSIPGGKIGICLVGGAGLLTSLFGFIVAFCPPTSIDIGSICIYETYLIGGVLAMTTFPFLLNKGRVIEE